MGRWVGGDQSTFHNKTKFEILIFILVLLKYLKTKFEISRFILVLLKYLKKRPENNWELFSREKKNNKK